MSEVEAAIPLAGVYDIEDGRIRRAEIFAERYERSKPSA